MNHYRMANMKEKLNKLSEKEIDELAIKDANDLSKWETPIEVKPAVRATVIRLNNQLIERAKFFASIYNMKSYQEWLEQIIEERIRQEEILLNDKTVQNRY